MSNNKMVISKRRINNRGIKTKYTEKYGEYLVLRRAARELAKLKCFNTALNDELREAKAELRRLTKPEYEIEASVNFPHTNQPIRALIRRETASLKTVDLAALTNELRSNMRQYVYDYKTPTKAENYLGIEIELIAKRSRSQMADDLLKNGLAAYVTLKEDGSIQTVPNSGTGEDAERCSACECGCGDSDDCEYCIGGCSCGDTQNDSRFYPTEVCVLCSEGELVDVVTRLCTYLRSVGAEVNQSCGLHVHIDMRHRNKSTAYRNLFQLQPLLFAMQPKSRQENNYCMWNSQDTFEEHGRVADRYYAINTRAFRQHKTLELRLHAGTVNASKIINWVSLLLSIVNADFSKVPADNNLHALVDALALPVNLTEYVVERVTKFKTARTDVSNVIQLKAATFTQPLVASVEELSDAVA